MKADQPGNPGDTQGAFLSLSCPKECECDIMLNLIKKHSDFTEEESPVCGRAAAAWKTDPYEGVSVNVDGSVANTGIAMKIPGTDVSQMGKVGDDAFGQKTRRDPENNEWDLG